MNPIKTLRDQACKASATPEKKNLNPTKLIALNLPFLYNFLKCWYYEGSISAGFKGMNDYQFIQVKKNKDPRGFALSPFEEVSPSSGHIRNFHVCSLKKGAIRGNHYHKNLEEYILFLGENFLLITENIGSGARKELHFRENEGRLLKINRMVGHCIKNEGDEILYLLCFYVSTDPIQPETIPHQILKAG